MIIVTHAVTGPPRHAAEPDMLIFCRPRLGTRPGGLGETQAFTRTTGRAAASRADYQCVVVPLDLRSESG